MGFERAWENHSKFIVPSKIHTPMAQDVGSADQGQARGYGHITLQCLIFGRTTGGQHFQLENLQRYLNNYFASFIS